MAIDAEQKIELIAKDIAVECGVEIVDISFMGRGKHALLRIRIDKEGGVSLGDCETFSRRFEAYLDVAGYISGQYTMEVSSPGLDRPLKTQGDFKRNIGKLVRVIIKEKIDNQSFFVGRLMEVSDSALVLSIGKKKGVSENIDIPFENISRARLEVEIK